MIGKFRHYYVRDDLPLIGIPTDEDEQVMQKTNQEKPRWYPSVDPWYTLNEQTINQSEIIKPPDGVPTASDLGFVAVSLLQSKNPILNETTNYYRLEPFQTKSITLQTERKMNGTHYLEPSINLPTTIRLVPGFIECKKGLN